MSSQSRSKVIRSINIDMPAELRPIYDVCQSALDEILLSKPVREKLSVIRGAKRWRDVIKPISDAISVVWDKYKGRLNTQSKYKRILCRHIASIIASNEEDLVIYTVLKTSGGDLSLAQETLRACGIWATMTRLRQALQWETPPELLPAQSVFVMNMGYGESAIYVQDNESMRFKVRPGWGASWCEYSMAIPPSVREQWNGVVLKPSFAVSDGVVYGTLPYECLPDVTEKTGRIMGVDLGVLQPYTAVILDKDGTYSQTYTPSRPLRRLVDKRSILRREQASLFRKIEEVQAYIDSGGPGANIERHRLRYETLVGVSDKLARLNRSLAELVAVEIVYIAKENDVEAIHLEDLRWYTGGAPNWTPALMRDAIVAAAELSGVRVHLINPSYSSKEHPINGERSEPDRDRVVRFSDGSEYDRDELAAINMAVRRRRNEKSKSNRRIKLRSKHTDTPKQLKRKTSRRCERRALVDSIKKVNSVTTSDRAHIAVGARPGGAYMPRPGRKLESGYMSPWCVLDTRQSLLLRRCEPSPPNVGSVSTNLGRQ